MTSLAEKIFKLVADIPEGRVATYGQIALLAHTSPRVVGQIIHKNTDTRKFPCHRVVRSDGKLALGYAFGGPSEQRRLLENEGVIFRNNKISLGKFRYLWAQQ